MSQNLLKTRLKVVKAEVDILISSLFLQNLLEMQNFFANCKISMFALNFCEIACLQKNAKYKMQNIFFVSVEISIQLLNFRAFKTRHENELEQIEEHILQVDDQINKKVF